MEGEDLDQNREDARSIDFVRGTHAQGESSGTDSRKRYCLVMILMICVICVLGVRRGGGVVVGLRRGRRSEVGGLQRGFQDEDTIS